VSQILVLFLYVIWATTQTDRAPTGSVDAARLLAFFAGFVMIVLTPALVVRLKTRLAVVRNPWKLHQNVGRMMTLCRVAIVAWFFAGVFGGATWVEFVSHAFGPLHGLPLSLPGMLIGPLPALLAWVGLWWAQYPADRIAREDSYLPLLKGNLPVHAPPTLAAFMDGGFRLQILATAVPLLLISLVRDIANLSLLGTGLANPRSGEVEAIVSIASALVVLAIAPEPLRRIFKTTRLPESSLRSRLDELCKTARTRYREVLLWNTGYAMGNAAVMGVLPQIRYVMLSDLLLETMTDREIEAVFAHELGHIVHRHTLWYVVFFVVVFAVGLAFEVATNAVLQQWNPQQWQGHAVEFTSVAMFAVGSIFAFGMLSRRLERQADVYAARAMEKRGLQKPATEDPRRSAVGEHGAAAIASALYRAASINHIPVTARSFRHGSIAKRARFIQDLAADPTFTFRFDRSMRVIYIAIFLSFAGGAAWIVWQILQPGNAT